MEIGQLYQLVLLIVLCAMILGVGLVVLINFGKASGVAGTAADTAINNTISALTPIASTWLGLIVTVAVLSIILTLVVRSFAGSSGGRK
jgi:hypothetical protein